MAYKLPYTGEELYNRLANDLATKSEVVSGVTPYFEDIYNQLNNTLVYRGMNPITSKDEDTAEYWQSQPTGIYWFSNNTALAPEGYTYGYLIHIRASNISYEIQQEYIGAPHGYRYSRGSNGSGWGGSNLTGEQAWKKLSYTSL